jgi:hypothetical protein
MVAFPRGLRTINDLYFDENAVLLVAQPNLSPDDVTSVTVWGDTRYRETLPCSGLVLFSGGVNADVASVLTSSPAVPLAYKRCA